MMRVDWMWCEELYWLLSRVSGNDGGEHLRCFQISLGFTNSSALLHHYYIQPCPHTDTPHTCPVMTLPLPAYSSILPKKKPPALSG